MVEDGGPTQEHAIEMLLDELPKMVECLTQQGLTEKLEQPMQQKLQQCLDHGGAVLAMPSTEPGRNLFFGDLLQLTAHALTLFSRAHEVEGPCAPFMHCFTITTVIFSQFVDPRQSAVLFGIPEEESTSLGTYILATIGDHFDYCLREVVFSCGSDDSSTDEMIHAKICCRVMWRTLCLCVGGAHKIDGETFLELCGNEVYFPVAFARVLIPCEADVAAPLMGLWSAAKNVNAANRIAAQQEGITGVAVLDEDGKRKLPNDESGDLADLYEYKKQIACAFVDDDIIPELCRALMEALYQWEQQPEVKQWFLAVLGAPDLTNQLVPPPAVLLSSKTQECARSVLLLYTAACRCFSEIANVVLDAHYRAWASRYGNLVGRMKRHLTLHGKGFLNHLVKPHFLPHNGAGMNSDLDLKLRMLVMSARDLSSNMETASVGIGESVKKLSVVLLDMLLALKDVNCEQIMGHEFLELVRSSLAHTPPILSTAADPAIYARIALLSLTPAMYTANTDEDGLLLEADTARLTQELFEHLDQVAQLRATCYQEPAFWRGCKKYLMAWFESTNVGVAAEFWHTGLTVQGGPLHRLEGQSAANMVDSHQTDLPMDSAYTDVLAQMHDSVGLFQQSNFITSAATGETPDINTGEESMQGLGGKGGGGGPRAHRGEVPEEFRCAIDGKLMQTPVRWLSPASGNVYVYELVTLQAWAEVQGDVCPVSGEAFTAEAPPAVDEGLKAKIEAFTSKM
ncbi:unnamed protein product [Amoebophrya sp. A120]|nr:unnamed protein product [Amoebophrya sp. A120]|eukprot:GSA120T00015388001.1